MNDHEDQVERFTKAYDSMPIPVIRRWSHILYPDFPSNPVTGYLHYATNINRPSEFPKLFVYSGTGWISLWHRAKHQIQIEDNESRRLRAVSEAAVFYRR